MGAMARVISMAAALLLSGAVAAQTFKCTDKTGKTTYSNITCKELGLKDAGEVPDRINVNPAYVPPPAPPTPASKPSASAPQEQGRSAPAPSPAAEVGRTAAPAAGDPDKPERRCFSVQVAPGKSVTRCNDKPDDAEKPAESGGG